MSASTTVKVLVAIDGSDQAKHALQWYLDMVHKDNYTVCLVHCVEPLHVIGEVPSAELYDRMLEESKSRARKVEEAYAQQLKERNVNGKVVGVIGTRPGEMIVDMAKKEAATMVVMGSRGLGTLRRTVMGSVSDYVLHHAHCPLIVCRDKVQAPIE